MRNFIKNNPAGFTLLEVMVSVAILAISLSVLLTFQGNTLIASGRQEKITVATMLARQRMVEVELELEKGMSRGEFPEPRTEEEVFDAPFGDYRWKMEVRNVELPAPVTGDEGSIQDMIAKQLSAQIAKSVRELSLEVMWEELGEPQSMKVVTHLVKL